jgi:isocitrate dehydrogenase (NAD+)
VIEFIVVEIVFTAVLQLISKIIGAGFMYNVTLIPGDGVGPEVSLATKRLIDAAGVKINWDIQEAGERMIGEYGTPLPQAVMNSIKNNGVALKGPITTPVGIGFRSVNVTLRKELDLYASVRPAKTYEGIPSRYENVDIIIVRENTEDLYVGVEHMIGDGAAESIKIFTRKGCERIIRYAFEFARKEGRKKVTAVHKANIMKCTDGMFLNIARVISKEYPEIEFEDMIIDALCMRLVQAPEAYDVLVLPNLYGDIVSDLCAGLVGGLGVVPGVNIGQGIAIFEPVHGSAPNIAGRDIANPTAMMLSGVQMLRYLGEMEAASRIEKAISKVLEEGKSVTCDLGGKLGTTAYTNQVISTLAQIK